MKTYFFDLTSAHINDIDDVLLDIFRSLARFMLVHDLQVLGRNFGGSYVLVNKCSNNRFMVQVRRVTKLDML